MDSDSVDLDKVLDTWAQAKVGSDHVIDLVDTSDVKVAQVPMASEYPELTKHLTVNTSGDEVFDNPSEYPIVWSYSQSMEYKATAEWTFARGIISKRLAIPTIVLTLPPFSGVDPVEVAIDLNDPDDRELERLCHLSVSRPVTVQPFSHTRACCQLTLANLNKLAFHTNIYLSGNVKVTAHRKRNRRHGQEVTSEIASIVSDIAGFDVVKTASGKQNMAMTRLSGYVSGMIPVGLSVQTTGVETSV